MHREPPSHDSLHHDLGPIPLREMPPEAEAFTRQVFNLLDGKPKDERTVADAFAGFDAMFDRIAAGLYSLASMLVGEGEDSTRLVESTIDTFAFSGSDDPVIAQQNCRRSVASQALELLARRDPDGLAAPEDHDGNVSCIDDDDLDAASGYGAELERMIAGPDRDRVRTWLESLPAALRTVFVLRATAAFSPEETADLLRTHGGPNADRWTAAAVRETFRRALCSLASQLLHATAFR